MLKRVFQVLFQACDPTAGEGEYHDAITSTAITNSHGAASKIILIVVNRFYNCFYSGNHHTHIPYPFLHYNNLFWGEPPHRPLHLHSSQSSSLEKCSLSRANRRRGKKITRKFSSSLPPLLTYVGVTEFNVNSMEMRYKRGRTDRNENGIGVRKFTTGN